ncbi:MAG: ABC transporter permease [Pseudochelatococcus sp.]|jgi:NitT/TauT family transport system permease protein|uniref:ABC transporter permease n=1 Tax=Pseudochelatococcus sp. TaxID=2020869 RepID=UPI003D8C12B5
MAAMISSTVDSSTFRAEKRRDYDDAVRRTKRLGTALAVISILVLWHFLALYNRPWVPSIADTLRSMQAALSGAQFYSDMLITWRRLLLAFLTATLVGVSIGVVVGFNKKAEAFCAPLIALALAVPDPVYIIFANLAIGTGELAGYIALVLAIVPFVINVVRTSVQARDVQLDEMSKIYHIPAGRHFQHVIVPQLVPSLLTAARFSFALSWKIVILVEALTQPEGIGARIYNYFHMLRMRDAIACAILFCVLMQLAEKVIFLPAEKRLMRWKS